METLSLDDSENETRPRARSKEMEEIQQQKRAPRVVRKPRSVDGEDARIAPKTENRTAPQPTRNPSNTLKNFADYDELRENYEDLKSEYKALNRVNHELASDLRDVKKQNATLIESYTAIQKEIQSGGNASSIKLAKSERAKYNEAFDYLQGKSDYFQDQFRKREDHLDYLTKQTRDANNERDATEEESRKLQRKIRDLQAQLTECRDDLLRLQPPAQMSDSELSDMYGNLCQHVATWVDDQTEDPDVLEKYFQRLNGVGDLPADVRTELNQRHFKLAKKHPECLPLLMQYVIHGRLKEEVLGPNIFVFGLDEGNIALLQGVEEGMGDLEPRRDAPTLRRWRSETLQALLKMEAFAEEQTRCGEALSQTLASTLSTMLLPPSTESASPTISWQEVHKQIVHPAIKLSNSIRVATTDYEFFSHLFSRPPPNPHVVYRQEIQHYAMTDLATQKVIRPDSQLKVTEEGRIGEEMFVISPGMVRSRREASGGMERSVMVKPGVLVKLDEPMGRKKVLKAANWGFGWLGGSEES